MKPSSFFATLAAGTLLAAIAGAQAPDIGATDAHLAIDETVLQNHVGPRVSWLTLPDCPIGVSRPGGVWIGNRYFLVGGETTSGGRNGIVQIFHGPSMTWTLSGVAMPTPVSNVSASVTSIGSKVYVVGGYSAALVGTTEVQVYDTLTDSWSVLPTPLPTPIWGALAVFVGGTRIIVTGGWDGVSAVATTYQYDISAGGSVTPKAAAPSARYLLSGAHNTSNSTVYSVAGFGTGTVMQGYHVPSNTWTVLPSLPVDRAGCGVVAIGNLVVAYMGNWASYFTDGDIFKVVPGSWAAGAVPPGPVGRRAFGNGLLNVPGVISGAGAFGGWAGAYLTSSNLIKG